MKQRKKQKIKLISVVIPAYRAEKIITKSLLRVKDVLDQMRYPYEIICVVDGYVDKTKQKVTTLVRRFPDKMKIVGYKNNLGKGHAVRYGMAKCKGDLIGFIDAGFDLDPNGLAMLLEHFVWYDADIIIGSKRHPASKVTYHWQRKVLSWGYQMLVRILFGLKVRDTQVGMKFFKREVLEKTMPRLLVKAFAFDVEMLAVAYHLGFKRIFEAPVELKTDFGDVSTVFSKGMWNTIFSMMADTLAVFYRLKILHYYDKIKQ